MLGPDNTSAVDGGVELDVLRVQFDTRPAVSDQNEPGHADFFTIARLTV